MRAFSAIFATAAVLLVGQPVVQAAVPGLEVARTSGTPFAADNHYGAPTPPWKSGVPGWYYGDHPPQGYPWLKDPIICLLLDLLPFPCLHCPKPPHHPPPPPPNDGWTPTFYNISAAVQADDYMTFGLVDTVDDCKAMCLSVAGCNFINTYHDVNGKDGSTRLTCSLFTNCHGPEDADNRGGQSQPDGSIDFIANSDGYCHSA